MVNNDNSVVIDYRPLLPFVYKYVSYRRAFDDRRTLYILFYSIISSIIIVTYIRSEVANNNGIDGRVIEHNKAIYWY